MLMSCITLWKKKSLFFKLSGNLTLFTLSHCFFSLLMFVAVMRTLAAITVPPSTSCPRSLLISSPIAWFPSLCFQQLPTTWWVTSSLHASRHTHTKHTLCRIMKDVLIQSVSTERSCCCFIHIHEMSYLGLTPNPQSGFAVWVRVWMQ